jgi:glycogen synthase
MNVCIMTNEFPPCIYGGAGVHVDYLTRELAKKINLAVHCFGAQRRSKTGFTVRGHNACFSAPVADKRFTRALDALARNLEMSGNLAAVDLVHCHTWYAHFAGLLARELYQVPLVLTAHSLEPSRPWKAEQLGRAYNVSAWVERTAYQTADGVIAVSGEMKNDIMRCYGVPADRIAVIHNGIDIKEFRKVPAGALCRRFGIDPHGPLVLFVGRITRQKGLNYLIEAANAIRSNTQIVLCAGEPDTPEIAVQTERAVAQARQRGARIVWIKEMLCAADKIKLYSRATVFVCPSIYEPFGITNLEAMACGTPVVASRVGGIVEVVEDGSCGFLVPFKARSASESAPANGAAFSAALAARINQIIDNPALHRRFAQAARQRVERYFGWDRIAAQTIRFYRGVITRYARQRRRGAAANGRCA